MSDDGIDPRKFKDLLLQAPHRDFDPTAHDLVRVWGENPKPIQILEVIDHCRRTERTTPSTMRLIHLMYDNALELHAEEHVDVAKKATWRKNSAE